MFGVGPEWVHLKQNGRWSDSIAGEIAADFMFWPTGKHRFGWYLEPAYDYSFASGHQKSIGISGGLHWCLLRRKGIIYDGDSCRAKYNREADTLVTVGDAWVDGR
jgi:hypothetical protein